MLYATALPIAAHHIKKGMSEDKLFSKLVGLGVSEEMASFVILEALLKGGE